MGFVQNTGLYRGRSIIQRLFCNHPDNLKAYAVSVEVTNVNIIAWAILGIVAGAIAKLLYPGSQGGGIINTMILGILGAFIGGSIVTLITTGTISLATAPGVPGLVVAILGAMIAIFLWGLVTGNAA